MLVQHCATRFEGEEFCQKVLKSLKHAEDAESIRAQMPAIEGLRGLFELMGCLRCEDGPELDRDYAAESPIVRLYVDDNSEDTVESDDFNDDDDRGHFDCEEPLSDRFLTEACGRDSRGSGGRRTGSDIWQSSEVDS